MEKITFENIQHAFAGESMAHMRYTHFAKLAEAAGDHETAKLFKDTAAQELKHALAHAELLYPAEVTGVLEALNIAASGESHEFTTMYPEFYKQAVKDRDEVAQQEFSDQISESKEHYEIFKKALQTAASRFKALAEVEKRHFNAYSARADKLK